MNKKYLVASLLFTMNSTTFYAVNVRQLAQLYTIAATGVGATTATVYLGGKSSQVNFDKDKTISLIRADIDKATANLQAQRQEFVQKEMAFYKSSAEHMEKTYKTMHAKVKSWIETPKK